MPYVCTLLKDDNLKDDNVWENESLTLRLLVCLSGKLKYYDLKVRQAFWFDLSWLVLLKFGKTLMNTSSLI
jgi:hypothetical protein